MAIARRFPETYGTPDWPRKVKMSFDLLADDFLGIAPSSVSVTAAYTVPVGVDLVLVDATSAGVTVTLPAASGATKRRITVKKVDASGNAVTIDGSGTETIDGTTTHAMSTQYESATVQSDGTQWWIV